MVYMFLRIGGGSVADPGGLSWIPNPDFYPSRISGLPLPPSLPLFCYSLPALLCYSLPVFDLFRPPCL
jgi:hypothetical protein